MSNNQETNRKLISAEIDERTLNEVYLRAFKDVIQEADPWMLMSAYNKVNGKYTFANKSILKVLLEKWAFSGFFVSDWFSWGVILAQSYFEGKFITGAWWTVLPPGFCLAALSTCFMFLGNTLDIILNPPKFRSVKSIQSKKSVEKSQLDLL